MRPIRALTQLLILPFPWAIRRRLLKLAFGYNLTSTARIGLSIVDVDRLCMGERSRIGHFNLFHGLESLDIGEAAIIGKFNWISGAPREGATVFTRESERCSKLVIGRDAAIVNWHLIDCADRVELGAFSVLSGAGSQILTHGVEIEENQQRCMPVRLGAYMFIGTRSVILKGTQLADYCVVGAGSVCAFRSSEPYGLYAGVPARRIKDIPKDAAYFSRTQGVVE